MCYPKPAPRCSNHATAALTKAREAFAASPSLITREAVATAEADYFLTPAGIKALRKDGRYEEAEMNAERREAAIAAFHRKDSPQAASLPEDDYARWLLANDPTTPPTLLTTLALDDDEEVALAALSNQATPCSAIQRQMKSTSPILSQQAHRAATSHPNPSEELLTALAASGWYESVGYAASHRNTPPDVLRTLSLSTERDSGNIWRDRWSIAYPTIRDAVAANRSSPEDVLEYLSTARRAAVREEVARNPSSPVAVVFALVNDANAEVAKQAKKSLDTRKDEARQWLNEHHPEMAELPLDWALGLLKPKK